MKKFENLVKGIKNIIGCSFANLAYISEVKGCKKFAKANGWETISKVVCGNVQLNYSYENAVNNRLARNGEEADFEAEKLSWGHWLEGAVNKIIENGDKLYLRFYGVKGADTHRIFLVDGRIATEEESKVIAEYLASKDTKSAKQTASGLAEEDQVVCRVVEFGNIIRLKCGEVDYDTTTHTDAVNIVWNAVAKEVEVSAK